MLPPQAHCYPPDPVDENWRYFADRFARLPIFQPQLHTARVSASFTAGSWSDVGPSFEWNKDESWSDVVFDVRVSVGSAGEWRILTEQNSFSTATALPDSPFSSALAVQSGLPSGRLVSVLQVDGTLTATDALIQVLVTECIPNPSE